MSEELMGEVHPESCDVQVICGTCGMNCSGISVDGVELYECDCGIIYEITVEVTMKVKCNVRNAHD